MSQLKQRRASGTLMDEKREWSQRSAGSWDTWRLKEGQMIGGCPCIWGLKGIFLEPRCNLPHDSAERVAWSSGAHT